MARGESPVVRKQVSWQRNSAGSATQCIALVLQPRRVADRTSGTGQALTTRPCAALYCSHRVHAILGPAINDGVTTDEIRPRPLLSHLYAIVLIFFTLALTGFPAAVEDEPLAAFDVASFVLPNCPPGEFRFEEAARHRGR